MVPGTSKSFPIDVVITWVDGNDARLEQKIQSLLSHKKTVSQWAVHPARFASVNEIRYCVLSILTFAPFVRNVFIVTDEQDPDLYDEIKAHFPERIDSVKIVDHKELFSGFEEYLPTFSSRSIETMLWNIKGLADHFVYFNDDIFLVRSIQPEDWFIDSSPVLRGRWRFIPLDKIVWEGLQLILKKYWHLLPTYFSRPSYHKGQWNSASLLGSKFRYFNYSHTPHAVERSVVERFFLANTEVLKKNISYRFRYPSQFTFISLSNHLQLGGGNRHIIRPDAAYLQPFGRGKHYIDKKIHFCERNTEIKFLCVQSLELCTSEQQKKLFKWLDKILGISKT